MSVFGERLKELREERELSLRELGASIDYSHTAISRWERGIQIPNIDVLLILCSFFDCSADYLIGLEN